MVCNLFYCFMTVVYFLVIDKKKMRNLLIYEIFGILILLTPQIANVILGVKASAGNTWLVYGILFPVLYLAYSGTEGLSAARKKTEWLAGILVFCILLQAGMGFYYRRQPFSLCTNPYKISEEVLQLAEHVDELEQKRVLAPELVATQLRRYSIDIYVPYGEGLSYTQEYLPQLLVEADAYGCNCIVINAEFDDAEGFTEAGYTLADTTESYLLYVR